MKLRRAYQNFLLILLILLPIPLFAQSLENNFEAISKQNYIIQENDNLRDLALDFDLGVEEILQANPHIIDPNFIQAGDKIILPIIHLFPDVTNEGIVINLAEPRLYYFLDDITESFPISVGIDKKTPIGKTKIIGRKENPFWTPPPSIRSENPELPDIVEPGPNNPLGNHALYLDASHDTKWQGITIHGTNAPWSIGAKVTHGCIRLYSQDIEKLFYLAKAGTSVTIVNQPFKISKINDKIYLEVHLEKTKEMGLKDLEVKELICQKIKNCLVAINWVKVNQAISQNLGIPVNISR